MSKRLPGVLLIAVLSLGVLAAPALAVEATGTEGAPAEEEPAPSISEIGSQNEVSKEFLPEEPETPAFFRFLNIPLIAVGLLVVTGLLFAYLTWQPRFAEERRSRQRRR